MEEVKNGQAGVSPPVSMTAADAAKLAAKKPKLMLTDLERIIFDSCVETGNTPGEALEFDLILHQRIVEKVTADCRVAHILGRLEQSPPWLRQQIVKLKAGVRDLKDELTVEAVEADRGFMIVPNSSRTTSPTAVGDESQEPLTPTASPSAQDEAIEHAFALARDDADRRSLDANSESWGMPSAESSVESSVESPN